MRDVKLHAAQTQLLAGHNTRAVSAAGGAYQPVRRGLRSAAAAQTADFDGRRLDEQGGIRRTATRTRNFECTREQGRFDSGQGPHLYRDSRDMVCTLFGGNFGYLGEQGLADGQLVHAFILSLGGKTCMCATVQTIKNIGVHIDKNRAKVSGDVKGWVRLPGT
jgi:hypothetical protein